MVVELAYDCWSPPLFTPELCCLPADSGGNPECWTEPPFTFELCCKRSQEAQINLRKTLDFAATARKSCFEGSAPKQAPWICCHPVFGPGGNRACWGSQVPAVAHGRCCRKEDELVAPFLDAGFPRWDNLTGDDEYQFTYHSYLDWMARCQVEHNAMGLYDEGKGNWSGSVQYELYYWAGHLRLMLKEKPKRFLEQLSPDTRLNETLASLIRPEAMDRQIEVLDVGSGPMSVLGKVGPNLRPLKLMATDPLACAYQQLLRQVGLDPTSAMVAVEAEKLLTRFGIESFDLVHGRNSLDHTWNPVSAVDAMVQLARPGAAVYLYHARNEGELENYSMLHQWNFDAGGEDERDAILHSPSMGSVNLTDRLLRLYNATTAVRVIPNEDTGDKGFRKDFVEFIIRKPKP
eukprot:TRINITY_DN23890_c0_g1_i5.p1 TRINITY_DN23890_c0_g1~~TRINITY_DN23890_c0_g1_i5.p1  ORF type:complete len:404 (+),score=65.59 TRINITY_DN23890_c0_g1_i5:94-1305(+)